MHACIRSARLGGEFSLYTRKKRPTNQVPNNLDCETVINNTYV